MSRIVPRRGLVGAIAAAALVLGGLVAATSAAAAPVQPHAVVGGADLGANTILFTPDMAQGDIQSTLDGIAAEQLGNQFGDARYAIMFAPGTYGSAGTPLNFQVGYYTQVMGLGQSPDDTVINGSVDVYNQCDSTSGCLALNNFWRSLSNLRINVANTVHCTNSEFWATSQASSLRRVDVSGGTTLMDYCDGGPDYASGGFIADSRFSGGVINGSQQQWLTRNSDVAGWTNGVWNQVFVGDEDAPAEDFTGANHYTTVATSPVEKETPYLYMDSSDRLNVFVPSTQASTSGTTWENGQTPGTSLPMSSFFLANPSTSDTAINAALGHGKNLIFTPGVYSVTKSIWVTHPDTVVLGLGLATLVPVGGITTMNVSGVPGVTLSGLLFDAGTTTSSKLLNLAPSTTTDANDPSLISDTYFRIGGARAGSVGTAVNIGTSNVVIDNLWAWRADHGNPGTVGWTVNTARNGVKVSGSNVTAYGLFVEHFQGAEVYWSGTNGKVFMFQNEMPYDVPSQSAWNYSARVKGFPAIVVPASGAHFRGYGVGSYSFFNQGLDIHATEAFLLAKGIDAHLHDALTVCLNGDGGIDSIVNHTGAPVNSSAYGTPSILVDY